MDNELRDQLWGLREQLREQLSVELRWRLAAELRDEQLWWQLRRQLWDKYDGQ